MAGQNRVLRNEKVHEKLQSREQFSDSANSTPDLRTTKHERHPLNREVLTYKINSDYGRTCKIIINLLPITTPFRIANSQQWRTEGVGVQPLPPPEIPKALQNRAKLNPIVKIDKNG